MQITYRHVLSFPDLLKKSNKLSDSKNRCVIYDCLDSSDSIGSRESSDFKNWRWKLKKVTLSGQKDFSDSKDNKDSYDYMENIDRI